MPRKAPIYMFSSPNEGPDSIHDLSTERTTAQQDISGLLSSDHALFSFI